jgi:hypothetical protein
LYSHLSGERNPDPTKERRSRCARLNDVLGQFRNLLRPPWPERGNALTSVFKHVVVFGELNFRVEMPRHRAETLSGNKIASFLRYQFLLKTIMMPRQARDKHTETTLKKRDAVSYTAEAKFEEVFLGDQLRMMREAGEVLAGFTEATPEFAPILDGLGAHWPSRVLYHTQAGYGQHVFYTVLY